MKYCIHCGQELSDGAKFCSKCGKKQASEEIPDPADKEKYLATFKELVDYFDKVSNLYDQYDECIKDLVTTDFDWPYFEELEGKSPEQYYLDKCYEADDLAKRLLDHYMASPIAKNLINIAYTNPSILRWKIWSLLEKTDNLTVDGACNLLDLMTFSTDRVSKNVYLEGQRMIRTARFPKDYNYCKAIFFHASFFDKAFTANEMHDALLDQIKELRDV